MNYYCRAGLTKNRQEEKIRSHEKRNTTSHNHETADDRQNTYSTQKAEADKGHTHAVARKRRNVLGLASILRQENLFVALIGSNQHCTIRSHRPPNNRADVSCLRLAFDLLI